MRTFLTTAVLIRAALALSLATTAHSAGAQDAAPTQLFVYENIAPRGTTPTAIREMLKGKTHAGLFVDLHVTELAPGQMPHAPHKHVHEEMLMILDGTIEVTTAGQTKRLGAGSAVYFASNQEHGWRNVGAKPAKYFVLALGDDGPPAAPARGGTK